MSCAVAIPNPNRSTVPSFGRVVSPSSPVLARQPNRQQHGTFNTRCQATVRTRAIQSDDAIARFLMLRRRFALAITVGSGGLPQRPKAAPRTDWKDQPAALTLQRMSLHVGRPPLVPWRQRPGTNVPSVRM